jgi:hypothetical protein
MDHILTVPDRKETAVDCVGTRTGGPCAPPLYGPVNDPCIGFKLPCPAEISEVGICSFAVCTNAGACTVEEPMKDWVLYVMTWASQLSGYPFPDSLPDVQWKSESWFSHRACNDHTPCPT